MRPLLSITAAALLSSCATFSSLPPEARQIRRVAVSSERVYVWKPALKFQDGGYVLRGAVQKRFRTESTLGTHLRIVFFDSTGSILREGEARFTPAELPITWGRRPRTGDYIISLDVLPPGTARIEVRAQDAP